LEALWKRKAATNGDKGRSEDSPETSDLQAKRDQTLPNVALDGYGEDMRIGCIGREGIIQAWEIFQSEIFRTAGSSAAVDGSRFERIYRDMSMLNSHRNTVLREWAFGELAREHLGLPRRGVGNVQTPRDAK
jgi:hypothetical protein